MALGFDLPKKKPINLEKMRENALFHYTDAKGLIGILDVNSIWATSYHCTNDRSEFNYSINVITKIFEDVLLEGNPNVSRIDLLTFNSKLDTIFRNHASKQFDETNAFISCFTMAKDLQSYEHGLLSQWRGYGKYGGYAIELDAKKFLNEIEVWNNKWKSESEDYIDVGTPIFSDVHYGYENNYWADSFRESFLKPLSNQFDELKHASFERIRVFLNRINGKNNLFLFKALTKNPHFREENELRLIVMLNKTCDHFSRDGLIVPYLKTPIDIKSCIRRIIIGPSPRIEDRKKSVRSLLIQHDLYDVEVKVSEIPYDGS